MYKNKSNDRINNFKNTRKPYKKDSLSLKRRPIEK